MHWQESSILIPPTPLAFAIPRYSLVLDIAGTVASFLCQILCITDTHIQEWDDIKKAFGEGKAVLFCIDLAYKDKHVEEALAGLGMVYNINRPEDLVSLVVDVAGRVYCGESFIYSQ